MKSLIPLLLMAGSAIAQPTIGVRVDNSSDSDGAQSHGYTYSTGYIFENFAIGYSYSDLKFSEQGWRETGHRHGLQLEYQDATYAFRADVGETSTRTTSTVTGAMEGSAWVSDNVQLFIGTERNLVDNQTGIVNGLTFTNYYVGGDVLFNGWGVAGVVGTTKYSDDNTRNFTRVKIYKDIIDGVNIYIRNFNYRNTKPYQGNYFAPRNYNQMLFGVGFRQRVLGGVLAGHYDAGRQRVDGDSELSKTWRLSYDVTTESGWRVGAYISEDGNQPGYTYRTNGVTVSLRF